MSSARKRKLVFKRYSIGHGWYWKFGIALMSDIESSILFGVSFDKLEAVTRSITMNKLHGFYYGRH